MTSDLAEQAFVADKRALGVSWSQLSRMLHRPEMDLRRDYDATFERVTPRRNLWSAPKPKWRRCG